MNHSFTKYGNAPLFGGEDLGTCFDVYVWRDNGRIGRSERIGLATKNGRELFPAQR